MFAFERRPDAAHYTVVNRYPGSAPDAPPVHVDIRARSGKADIVIGAAPCPVADACELVIEVLVELGEDRVLGPS